MNFKTIQTALRRIEKAERIRILYACESGSRAWGFPSADSDYDIRYIYVRSQDWYWAIDAGHRPDTLQEPIKGTLDVCGWDLRKTLGLLAKSNPSLMEWLGSPIVYRRNKAAHEGLRRLRKRYFDPIACALHYRSMARSNYESLIKDSPTAKRYLYVLRPLLAVEWLDRFHDIVPTLFDSLLERLLPGGPIRQAIDGLIASKVTQKEKDSAPNPILNHFIEERIKYDINPESKGPRAARQNLTALNQFFRRIVERKTR